MALSNLVQRSGAEGEDVSAEMVANQSPELARVHKSIVPLASIPSQSSCISAQSHSRSPVSTAAGPDAGTSDPSAKRPTCQQGPGYGERSCSGTASDGVVSATGHPLSGSGHRLCRAQLCLGLGNPPNGTSNGYSSLR
jgi:hypothetical protein